MIAPESWKEWFGLVAVLFSIGSFFPYLWDLFSGSTKPHAFSWLIWTLSCGIIFAAQVHDRAGSGSWSVGAAGAGCLLIFFLALVWGEKEITRSDWYCLIAGLGAIPLWIITQEPLLSVLLITAVDIFALWPTVRKSYHKPRQETLASYVMGALYNACALLAMKHYSLVTSLFPVWAFLSQVGFVTMLFLRRKSLR